MLKNESLNLRGTSECTLTRQCFNHQSSCCKYKVHFISSSGLDPSPALGRSGDHLALPLPTACTRPPQHSRQAGCVTSAVSVLTPASSMEGEESTERSTKGSVSKLRPPPTRYRYPRGGCQGCLLLKNGAPEQRPHIFNPTSPGPCKTCVKKLQVLSDPVVET